MLNVKCPHCEIRFVLEVELKVGQVVSCPHCQRSSELVWLYPPELSLVDEAPPARKPQSPFSKPISG